MTKKREEIRKIEWKKATNKNKNVGDEKTKESRHGLRPCIAYPEEKVRRPASYNKL